jgi:Zn-dependent protease
LVGGLSVTRWLIGAAVCLVWMLSLSCHEFAHAIVAYCGGDQSVKTKGYLTLNPFSYTDIRMTVLLPAVFLLMGGIGLPGAAVYVNSAMLRNRAWDSAVSAAGPLATALFTILLSVVYSLLVRQMPNSLSEAIRYDPQFFGALAAVALLVYFHSACVILNFLPVPGLDGFGIIEPWLPSSLRNRLARVGNLGIAMVFAVLWLPLPNKILWSSAAFICDLLGVPSALGNLGYELYRYPISAGAILLIVSMYIFKRKAMTAPSSETTTSPESTSPPAPSDGQIDATSPDRENA